ncbi:dihydropteroate synthase [Longispora albida]|uniref:dihydropteroate synthase n=1 Tax=Longispora albida TaxID=203523 RepID=UPI0003818E7C|nr:dihydropteroate synthase [Longispora albida]
MSTPVILGVLNVTPDSFSDGGRHLDTAAAITRGLELAAEGADYVDIGGESTRPGAARVDEAEELARIIPVIRELSRSGVRISVDTTRAAVAAEAVAAGASIINDVSGGLADPGMARVAAETGVLWVLMHWRGHSRDMQSQAVYSDVVTEVRDELAARVSEALAAGVKREQLVLDPGLGFAKTGEHNWPLLARMPVLHELGLPLLIGASRKSFLGALLADKNGTPRAADGREYATAAISLLSAQGGAWGLRVHDVRATADVLAVLHRMEQER